MYVRSSNIYRTASWFKHLLPALLLLAMAACRKQDIQPEPVGEPVAYNGPTGSLQEVIEKSPYTIFKAAWKRAGMDARVEAQHTKAFTLFVPTDKAFQDAGWTVEKISAASAGSLDTLLSYYVATGNYNVASVSHTIGNQHLVTLLKSGDVPNYDTYNPYQYCLYTGFYNDSLFVNGIAMSKWGNALEGSTVTLYPVDKLIALPQMDMLTYLQSDPRFYFYLEACRINDSLYLDQFPYDNILLNLPLLSAIPGTGGPFTLFVPTNDAFRKSGFNSVDDIRNYATRSLPIGTPDYNQDMYYVYPTTALDSLLLPHRMDFVGASGPTTGLRDMAAVYYSNELKDNSKLSGFAFTLGSVYNLAAHLLRLDINNVNGQVMIKRLGAPETALPLSQEDITVFNGVIHVVNDGLYKQ